MAEQRGLRYLDLEPKGYSPYAGGKEFLQAVMPPPVRAAGMLANVVANGVVDLAGIKPQPSLPGATQTLRRPLRGITQ